MLMLLWPLPPTRAAFFKAVDFPAPPNRGTRKGRRYQRRTAPQPQIGCPGMKGRILILKN